MAGTFSRLFYAKTHGFATDLGLLLVRLAAGGMMTYAHGIPKWNSFVEKAEKFADPLGIGSANSLMLAIFAEVVCSILLMAGLFSRLATIPLMVTMAVATFIIHADDPFSKQEFALLYFFLFLIIFMAGPGRFSLDAAFFNKRRFSR